MGIARNRAVDLLRSRPHQARLREREPLAGLVTEPAQRDATDSITLRRAVASALHDLPTGQR
jgi:DNA-directed RNA polymerase specialized sigma24 family protein